MRFLFSAQIAALPAASNWLVALMTGNLATIIAILAIAFFGFGMLLGRIDVRRGVMMVLGCFILFGAPAIATALKNLTAGGSDASAVPPSVPSEQKKAQLAPTTHADPYAGPALTR